MLVYKYDVEMKTAVRLVKINTMFKLILIFTTAVAVCCGSNVSMSPKLITDHFKYYYYGPGNRNPIILSEADVPSGMVPIAPFDNDWDIVVIIHGHGGTATTTLNPLVKDAFLSTGNYNIIVVDWSLFSSFSYDIAREYVVSVGSNVFMLLQRLYLPLNKIHIVGFDLGAHAAGFTGRLFQGNIARITALDPSAQSWENDPNRLNIYDAQYVEVIHTDGTGANSLGLGVPIGHMDFYVNGRSSQPGCTTNLCNHNFAYEVFAATITHPGHVGHQCNSDYHVISNSCRGFAVQMGSTNLVKFGSGIFRVNTGLVYPYHSS